MHVCKPRSVLGPRLKLDLPKDERVKAVPNGGPPFGVSGTLVSFGKCFLAGLLLILIIINLRLTLPARLRFCLRAPSFCCCLTLCLPFRLRLRLTFCLRFSFRFRFRFRSLATPTPLHLFWWQFFLFRFIIFKLLFLLSFIIAFLLRYIIIFFLFIILGLFLSGFSLCEGKLLLPKKYIKFLLVLLVFLGFCFWWIFVCTLAATFSLLHGFGMIWIE